MPQPAPSQDARLKTARGMERGGRNSRRTVQQRDRITGITWLRRFCRCGFWASAAVSTPTSWMRCGGRLPARHGHPDNTHPAPNHQYEPGGQSPCSAAEQTVSTRWSLPVVTVVISAGNEGGRWIPRQLQGRRRIAGIRQVGTKVGFSSFGPERWHWLRPPAIAVECFGACLFSIDTSINNGTTTPGTAVIRTS